MACDPAQPRPPSRQGFRDEMAAHSLKLGCIQGQAKQSAADQESNPGWRQAQQRAKHRQTGTAGDSQTSCG